jgi:hypothetical protein
MAPKKAGGGEMFVALRAFGSLAEGSSFLIQPGTVVDANDPAYLASPENFAPLELKVRNYPGRVESATAAPGEKRG